MFLANGACFVSVQQRECTHLFRVASSLSGYSPKKAETFFFFFFSRRNSQQQKQVTKLIILLLSYDSVNIRPLGPIIAIDNTAFLCSYTHITLISRGAPRGGYSGFVHRERHICKTAISVGSPHPAHKRGTVGY